MKVCVDKKKIVEVETLTKGKCFANLNSENDFYMVVKKDMYDSYIISVNIYTGDECYFAPNTKVEFLPHATFLPAGFSRISYKEN